jgi:hypothetical protein
LVSWFQCQVALNVQTNLIKNEHNSGIKRALAVVMLLQIVKPYENAVLLLQHLTRVHIPMFTLPIKQNTLANKKNKKEVDNEESL